MKLQHKLLGVLCLIGGLALAATTQKAPNAEAIFKGADKNGDGKVTSDELPNPETFSMFDLNKDGVITLQEAREVLGKMRSKAPASTSTDTPDAAPTETSSPEHIFDYLDKNKDGVLTD